MKTQSRKRRPAPVDEPASSFQPEAHEDDSDAAVRAALRAADIPEVLQGPEGAREMPSIVARRRRGPLVDPGIVAMNLLRRDGVLRWELASAPSVPTNDPGIRRAGYVRATSRETPIEQIEFTPLPPSDVHRFLAATDQWLTPDRGLRRITAAADGQFVLTPYVPAAGKNSDRMLLLIHGTFSKGDQYRIELASTPHGRRLLGRALLAYDHVVVFDHATLSVSPMLNALDLAGLLRGYRGRIDVVAHSRGGLVARWWLEQFERDPSRVHEVVLVGVPLAGTSLAAPRALRKTLDFFSNILGVVDKGAGLAAAAIPLAAVVKAFVRLTGTILHWAAEAPIVDAAIALVPGIEAMSFVEGNGELERLCGHGRFPIDRYAAIEADFQPTRVGWKFWRLFTDKPILRLVNAGADYLFAGANDLVVDTLSMHALLGHTLVDVHSPIAARRRHSFSGDEVHHLSYFTHAATLKRLHEWLALPA